MKGETPTAKDAMLQQVRLDFVNLEQQISGVEVLLEASDVQAAVRSAVRDYVRDVRHGLAEMQSNVLHLAEIFGVDHRELRQTGHQSMAELFGEWKADEAAGKRADAHAVSMGTLGDFFGRKMEEQSGEKERDVGMER